nr:hypothetical protein [Verrucomicrobium spinosum]
MRAVITSEVSSVAEAVALAQASPSMEGSDYVKEVSTVNPYHWDADNSDSCRWDIPNPSQGTLGGETGVFHPLGETRHRVVAYDFGIKRNILRRLRQEDLKFRSFPPPPRRKTCLRSSQTASF